MPKQEKRMDRKAGRWTDRQTDLDRWIWSLTFNSPLATLKASSTTLPAAIRDAVEVCDSFQMVSLSTSRENNETKINK